MHVQCQTDFLCDQPSMGTLVDLGPVKEMLQKVYICS
jgi:hypothetical protein